MADYQIDLEEVTDLVNDFHGNAVDETAQYFADNNTDIEIDNTDPDNFYPDLIVRNWSEPVSPTATINGLPLTGNIIGGSTPIKRPR